MPVMTERKINWYRVPIDQATLQSLNRRSDVRGFLQTGGHLGLLAMAAAAALYSFQQELWLSMIAAIMLYGFCASFMINGVHELVHDSVFHSKWLNTLFVHLMSFLGWINHYQFWASHTGHHKYTLNPPDDLEVTLPTRHSKKGLLKTGFVNPWALRGSILATWKKCRGIFDGEWEVKTCNTDKIKRRIVNWARFMMFAHLSIAIISIAYGYWIIPILVSCGPFICSLPFQLCNNTQHAGLMDNVNDFRLSCRTVKLSPLLRFLYWHMNFHIEHHMFAAVPCYRLGHLHKLIKPQLPPTKNLSDTWQEIFEIQQRQKTEPDYQYRQPLPDTGHTKSEQKSAAVEAFAPTPETNDSLKVWECRACAFIYDEAKGLPEEDIAPGTRWEDIPDDWSCPDCGVAKKHFNMRELQLAG